MAKSPYPVDPYLTGIAIAYKNDRYIADSIAPYVPVGKELFEWDQYNLADNYTIPDTKVGRLSAPNQVTFSATRIQDSTQDYGLDSPVPQKDIDNADANYDPRGRATEGVMELIKLDREARVAFTVFNSGSYPATQRTTLFSTSQWSDATNSNPLTAIGNALDIPIIRPNVMVLGQDTWTNLRRHPKIVEACLGTSAQQGMVSRQAVADLFELEEVLVGQSRRNVAKPGQTVNLTRLWGKHCSLFYRNSLASLTNSQMPTFMMTARFGSPTAGIIVDPDMGLDGGVRVRAGEKVKEVVVSNLVGFLFENAVA